MLHRLSFACPRNVSQDGPPEWGAGLKDRHGEPVAEVLDAAKRHIGELSMEIELLRARARAAEQRLPLAMRRSRR